MSDELDRIKNKIRSEEDELPSTWMLTSYHNHLKRTGASARGTQANYLKSLRKIMKKEDITPEQLKELSEEDLKDLNRRIIDNIQSSKYRITEGKSTKRRKRQYWSAWKKMLETQDWNTKNSKGYMPEVKFTDSQDSTAVTRPEDLPTRSQMQHFLRNLKKKSMPHVALRNQALAVLLWDKGPRIGEALQIKIKHVSVNGKQLKIRIPGNKKSETRKVEVFQGRKTLKDWLQQHPYRENREAYLFCHIQKDLPREKLGRNPVAQKFHQARADLDFKTRNEPFHIFRKAMVTFHIVNEFASWEQICKWHGKKTDATKPDYLKMALSDVDASVAANMGVSDGVDRNRDNRMLGKPLLPLECIGCGRQNLCFEEVCTLCGENLPETEMPDHLDIDEDNIRDLDKQSDSVRKLSERLDELEDEMS